MTVDQTRKAMNGVKEPKQQVKPGDKKLGNTRQYSSLNRGRPNIFAMKAGLELFDRDPSIGILPVLPVEDEEKWLLDGFEALVLAESADQYVQIGATRIPMGMGVAFLTLLNSSVAEDLQKIQLALGSMAEICLRTATVLRSKSAPKYKPAGTREEAEGSEDAEGSEEAEAGSDGTFSADESDSHSDFVRSCRPSHEKYIREIHESFEQTGYIWVPNPDKIPENTLFRVVRFGPGNFYNKIPDSGLHPAPIPDLLQQRNLNVLVNHLYKKNLFPSVPFTSGVFAAFWPSCLDLDSTGATCNLCRYDIPESLQESGIGGWCLSFAAQAFAITHMSAHAPHHWAALGRLSWQGIFTSCAVACHKRVEIQSSTR
jgi:hypothetical protein